MAKIERLIKTLEETDDPSKACDAINALGKKTEGDERAPAMAALARCAEHGRVNQVMRTHALAALSCMLSENDKDFTELFERCAKSHDAGTAWWGAEGLAKIIGVEAAPILLPMVFEPERTTESKAHVIALLSHVTDNPFDYGKPEEFRQWRDGDIDREALAKWAEAGYPAGNGYAQPERHPSLDSPATPVEKLCARLDAKLSKKRAACQNPAHPSNWLIPAEAEDLAKITARWPLPADYLEFLEKGSPLAAQLKIKGYGAITLYGVHNLIEGQDGYSYNPVEKQRIEDWPDSLVVIAQRWGDPFCLDLSKDEPPVLFAFHGEGLWQFTEEFPNFLAFLKSVTA